MELPIGEMQARFAEAVAAAARGERVVVTKGGEPFVELVPARKPGVDWEKAARLRQELGIDRLGIDLPPYFDDPAYSRHVLGLDDE